jgi:hypothetical protein
MSCPPGLFFNTQTNDCDFELNVPECVGGTRPPTTGDPTPSTSTTTLRPTSTTQSPGNETIRTALTSNLTKVLKLKLITIYKLYSSKLRGHIYRQLRHHRIPYRPQLHSIRALCFHPSLRVFHWFPLHSGHRSWSVLRPRHCKRSHQHLHLREYRSPGLCPFGTAYSLDPNLCLWDPRCNCLPI